MSKVSTLATLLELAPTGFLVDPFVSFSVGEWTSDSEGVVERILTALSAEMLIVRSSTVAEAQQESFAGAFGSVLGVTRDRRDLASAISSVVATYGRAGRSMSLQDRVFVQHQVVDASLAGVATTLDDDALPYITIAYDTSGRTSVVTQGDVSSIVRIRRGSRVPNKWSALVSALVEVCRMLGDDDLVVEFAADKVGAVHIFQAWSKHRQAKISEHEVQWREARAYAEYSRLGHPVGSTMSDWNPAEILGRQPSPLATSLYQEIVTTRIWSQARARLGYYDQVGDLMFVLEGTPYVDVERSLRSLTPAGLRESVRLEVVGSQLAHLTKYPTLHDKLEWRVAISTTLLGSDPRLDIIPRGARTDLLDALRTLTTQALRQHQVGGSAHVRALQRMRKCLVSQPLTAQLLADGLETLRKHGTRPFAIHARLAFMLRDLVEQGVSSGALPADTLDICLRRTRTGAGALAESLRSVVTGSLSAEKFLLRFGHLRPAAYEIESQRYDDVGVLEMMLQRTVEPGRAQGTSMVHYPDPGRFDALLASAGLALDGRSILESLSAEMSERERLKFHFTGLLSDLLEKLAEAGADRGLARSQIARIPASALLADRWEPTTSEWQMPMPDFLTPTLSLECLERGLEEPTFAGSGSFSGPPVVVNRDLVPSDSPSGCVVLMESAEPGCDWILATGLGALVTAYGGSASHMAIRAAELGIPMAIGCGLETLKRLAEASNVLVDTQRRLLTVGV